MAGLPPENFKTIIIPDHQSEPLKICEQSHSPTCTMGSTCTYPGVIYSNFFLVGLLLSFQELYRAALVFLLSMFLACNKG